MKQGLRTNITLKTKTSALLTRKIVVGASVTLMAFSVSIIFVYWSSPEEAHAASVFRSIDTHTGSWESVDSWTGNSIPSTSDNYSISGTITKNEDLSLGNDQSLIVNSADTLIIVGNLALEDKATLIVMSDAVLIVRGNYLAKEKAHDLVESNGTMVIAGTVTFTGEGSHLTTAPGANIYYNETTNTSLAAVITDGASLFNIKEIPENIYSFTHGVSLPVKVTNFSANQIDRKVSLDWAISRESGVKSYEVKRSVNGMNFWAIGKVIPRNNKNANMAYSFIDNNPVEGCNYKICILYNDNHYDYSPITSINTSVDDLDITVHPGGKKIDLKNKKLLNKPMVVSIYDNLGRKVYSDKVKYSSLKESSIIFPKKLDNGVHFIHFSFENHLEKKKFMVKG